VELNVHTGELRALVSAAEWAARTPRRITEDSSHGYGRDLFVAQRRVVTTPEQGASTLFID